MSYIPNNEMILSEVKAELERFTEKLKKAIGSGRIKVIQDSNLKHILK